MDGVPGRLVLRCEAVAHPASFPGFPSICYRSHRWPLCLGTSVNTEGRLSMMISVLSFFHEAQTLSHQAPGAVSLLNSNPLSTVFLSHPGLTCASHTNRGESDMPTTLAGSSEALLGHCCKDPTGPQGILGGGMQNDVPPPPQALGFWTGRARQVCFAPGGKGRRRAEASSSQPQLTLLLYPAKPRWCNYLVNSVLVRDWFPEPKTSLD